MDLPTFHDVSEYKAWRPVSSPFELLFFTLKLSAARFLKMTSQWLKYLLVAVTTTTRVMSTPAVLQPTPPMGKLLSLK
jgi:hypothetical protein